MGKITIRQPHPPRTPTHKQQDPPNNSFHLCTASGVSSRHPLCSPPTKARSDRWESRLSLLSQSAEMERLLWCQSRISPPNLMNLLAETRKLKHSGRYWLRDC